MCDFSVNEMLDMQKRLQDKYRDKWESLSPQAGKHKLLWMIGEIGEVIDLVKKHGDIKASHDVELRKDLVEEWLMFLCITMMSCYVMEYLLTN